MDILISSYKKFGLVCLFLLPFFVLAQNKREVKIEHANSLLHNAEIVANAQRLIGDVQLRHNNVQMWCDSAYSYIDTNVVDGFGHVHILKDDTLHLYADFVNYNGDTKLAKARMNVRLVNKSTTLTTDSLNYDMNTGIGYYNNYGTVKDSTSTLNSKIGEYYAREDKAYFKTEVKGDANGYILNSDTLIYQMGTGVVSIVGPTTIYNEENKLFATDGFYNTKTGKADLFKRPVITRANQRITADTVYYDKISGNGLALGDADINDLKNHVVVKGNRIEYDDKAQTAMAIDSAQFWYYTDKDTLFLHADTLRTLPDSIPDKKIMKAYFHVRFYREDIQGKCDSLVYWSRDSTTQMFHDPVIWSGANQMTAGYIKLVTKDKDTQRAYMENNAFIVAQEDSDKFNQIKGRDMTGYIHLRDLYKVNVDGNGESLYYARDDNGIIGLNKAESSSIIIYLKQSKVHKISLLTSPDGQMTPLGQITEPDKSLKDFKWLDDIRPKSYKDIFLEINQKK